MRTLIKRSTAFMMVCVMLVCGVFYGSFALPVAAEPSGKTAGEDVTGTGYPSYAEVYSGYSLDSVYNSEKVEIGAEDMRFSDDYETVYDMFDGKQTLVWFGEEKVIKADFSCLKGLYTIEVDYICDTSRAMDIVRILSIDGRPPFEEARNLKFTQVWEPNGIQEDAYGNQQSIPLEQKERLQTLAIQDIGAVYTTPLLFMLDEGTHTLELEFIAGFMRIAAIRLVPYKPLPSYEHYRSMHGDTENYKGIPLTVQGENPFETSNRTLFGWSNKDTSMEPFDVKKSLINTIGGWNWRDGNDWISWEFQVTQPGWYKLALRVESDYDGMVVWRQIMVDSQVPFREMEAYPFSSKSGYRTEVLNNGGEPYLFYLDEGRHVITLKTVVGGTAAITNDILRLVQEVMATAREVQIIVGQNPDPNFNYELDKKMPWLLEALSGYADSLDELAERLDSIGNGRSRMGAGLRSEAERLRSMVKNPRDIPMKSVDLAQIPATLSDYSGNMQQMPLSVDFVSLEAPDEEVVQRKASFWKSVQSAFWDFVLTFIQDYSQVENSSEGAEIIDVWISRGRDWGEIIQRLAQSDFTPRTGIRVRINIVSEGNAGVVGGTSALLMSLLSGNEPDIALGSDMDTPIELAIRKSAMELENFESFNDVAGRFHPAALTPFTYKDSVYALPETIDIPLLIYRSDIFRELGIGVPDTWNELWTYTLPKLSKNNGLFYMNSVPAGAGVSQKISVYASLLFQNGGQFYTADGYSALDTEEAFRAFQEWTKAVTQYRSPQQANLYNEMRIGTIPLAVGYLNDYLMLDIAAPELYGRFDIAPIPGMENADGEIVRYGAGSVTSAVMFQKAGDRSEAAWKFLDWWTSTDIQTQFSGEIVSRLGPTARWFSANQEAFYALPWGSGRLKIIKEWMPWYQNMSNTLGGHMTSRAVVNAWTRSAFGSMKPRDSLEQAYDEIQIEIERKRLQYGE